MLTTIVPQAFSEDQALKARFWYERLQYTFGPYPLAAGETPIFSASALQPDAGHPQWRTHLVRVAGTQTPQAFLTISYDVHRVGGSSASGSLAAMPAGYRPDTQWDVPALTSMHMTVTAAATISTFVFNYQIVRARLTVAEKLLLGMGDDLDPEEEMALHYGTAASVIPHRADQQPFHLQAAAKKGTLPIGWQQALERRVANRVVQVRPTLAYVPTVGTSPTAIGNPIRALDADHILILRSIALENDPSTGAPPNILLAVNRDKQENLMGLSGAAYLQADGAPWDVFLPARNSISFYAQAVTGTANVALRCDVWDVKLSDVLSVWYGLARLGARGLPDRTYLGTVAGVS